MAAPVDVNFRPESLSFLSDSKYSQDEIGPQNFTKLAKLGTGYCGKVYLVQSDGLEHDGIFAMKVIDKNELLERNRVRRVLTEKELLGIARHPLIVTLYHTFQTQKYLYLVMEYCAGGELFTLLQRQENRRLSESQATFYAAQVLVALEYLHLLGIIYRDLKPENVLVHSSGHIRLTDFDLSWQQSKSPINVSPRRRRSLWFRVEKDSRPRRRHSICDCASMYSYPNIDTETHLSQSQRRVSFVGTHEYIAPEIIAEEGYAGSVDWWSFGVLIYEMLFSKTPFKGKTNMETLGKILDEDDKLTFPDEVIVTSACRDLLKKLLAKDVDDRLCNPVDIKKHPFFAQVKWPLIRNQKPPLIPVLKDKLDTQNFPRYRSSEDSDDEILLPPTSPMRTSPKKPLSRALSLCENQMKFEDFNYKSGSLRRAPSFATFGKK